MAVIVELGIFHWGDLVKFNQFGYGYGLVIGFSGLFYRVFIGFTYTTMYRMYTCIDSLVFVIPITIVI